MAVKISSTSILWTGIFYLLYAILAYLVFLLCEKIVATYRARKNPHYAQIPSSPRHWFWGNLINDGSHLSPSLGRHPDYGMEEIWHKLDCPPAFLLDLYPIDFGVLTIADPTITEQLVEPSPLFKYSVPKSDTLQNLKLLIGNESILTAEGEMWRALRRRLNKGFSPQHLHSLSPLIMSKVDVFVSRLKDYAKSHEVFLMHAISQDLTTDIITELAMSTDFDAQTCPEGQGEKSWPFGVLTASRILSALAFKNGQGIGWHLIDPIRPLRAKFYETVVNWRLYGIISQQLRRQSPNSKASRSISALASEGLTVDSSLIWNTVAQVKTFLFAGQDTTATLLQWIAYELSKSTSGRFPAHADIHSKLCAEHDSVFGAEDPFSALSVLSDSSKSESILGDKLPYTTAFVKECLRLHPPAATARMIPEISPTSPEYTIPIPGKGDVAINGLRIYACQWLIHRNKSVWGPDAEVFRPERWLDKAYVESLPVGAYRPFERGPRGCIGQTLAQIEGLIGCCVMTRGFLFRKEGLDGLTDGAKEVWNGHMVTSVPVDGMKMSVKMNGARV